MRDPKTMIRAYEYIDQVPDIIVLKTLPQYDRYDYDLGDETDFRNYLKAVKNAVRNSFEYRALIQYLRFYMDMHQCAIYENITNIDTTKIKIEIHHEPLSLEDICLIVFAKRKTHNELLDVEIVAKEVMYLHYNLLVGLIPLAETAHELVHNKYLSVPTAAVLGKYREFVNMYENYMSPEQKETLENIERTTSDIVDDYKTVLAKKYIYIDASDAYEEPSLEEVVTLIRTQLTNILNGNNTVQQENKPETGREPMYFYE